MSLEDIRHYLARAKGYDLAMNDYQRQLIPVPIYLFKATAAEEDSVSHSYDSDGHLADP